MKMQTKKTETITIRCTAKEREMMERKAVKQGKSLSEYMVDNGMAGTERRTCRERRRISKLVSNQERLNRLNKSMNTIISGEKEKGEFCRLLEEELKLWEF